MLSKPRGALQTLLFAGAVAVVLGTIVSTVSVWLAPRQAENQKREREGVLQSLLSRDPALAALLEADVGGAVGLDARVVDLDTGCYMAGIDPARFDAEMASSDPRQQRVIAADQDIASIRERPNRVVVYEARRDRELVLLILPVYGLGYQSRLEGFLSLEADLETVSSLAFYRHGETPGMGARIGDPAWHATWRGKRTRDEAGQLRIGVAVRDDREASPYEVDAMSGATRTGQGVTNLLRFWLGEMGFAPLIRNLKSAATCVAATR